MNEVKKFKEMFATGIRFPYEISARTQREFETSNTKKRQIQIPNVMPPLEIRPIMIAVESHCRESTAGEMIRRFVHLSPNLPKSTSTMNGW
ncbi:unnamed protein product [Leptosia nina]|uniref:Uncharacterized protein n=1 Tax=Leptosia nina TaxID=320188 RepID=A0AAV1IV44_9NEOP